MLALLLPGIARAGDEAGPAIGALVAVSQACETCLTELGVDPSLRMPLTLLVGFVVIPFANDAYQRGKRRILAWQAARKGLPAPEDEVAALRAEVAALKAAMPRAPEGEGA